MNLTKSIWDSVFFLACSLSTGYFVYLQFLYYLRNEDVASIAYRTFNEEAIDEYPQITICFGASSRGSIFKKERFNDSRFAPKAYVRYLRGRSENENLTFDRINYDDVTFRIEKGDGYVKALNSDVVKGDKSSREKMPMILTFEDPSSICYSKNVSFRRNVRFTRDQILLN